MAQQVARTLRRLGTPEALTGAVVHGFGRGSAQLGFPTANLEIDWTDGAKAPAAARIRTFVDTHDTGIYAAWAQVADGPDSGVYKAAVSVGWNPCAGGVPSLASRRWRLGPRVRRRRAARTHVRRFRPARGVEGPRALAREARVAAAREHERPRAAHVRHVRVRFAVRPLPHLEAPGPQ